MMNIVIELCTICTASLLAYVSIFNANIECALNISWHDFVLVHGSLCVWGGGWGEVNEHNASK